MWARNSPPQLRVAWNGETGRDQWESQWHELNQNGTHCKVSENKIVIGTIVQKCMIGSV